MADGSSAAQRLGHRARQASDGWIEAFARVGYAVKGVVYGVVGVLALQAALGAGGGTESSEGVIRRMASQPFGQILLAVTAAGLFGYALWRFVQAAQDPEGKGRDAKGLIQRTGYLVSGFAYTGLALTAARIVIGSSGGGGQNRAAWTARLMEQPFGRWLVALVGLIVVGVGLQHFVQAYRASFMEQYDTGAMQARQRRWAERLGRFGLSARGVTFCLIGGFFLQAALQADPQEAEGLEGALETLAAQPYGPWLLGLVAAGFIAYGLYCFSAARYRRIQTR